MPLILPGRSRLQPVGPVHIDWSHPLASGLIYYVLGQGNPELISRGDSQRLGTATLVSDEYGRAMRSNADTSSGWAYRLDKGLLGTIKGSLTIAARVKIDSFSANGKILCAPLSNSTWTAPYMAFGLGAIGTGDSIFLFTHPGAGGGTTLTRAQFANGTMSLGYHDYVLSRDVTAAEGLIDGVVSATQLNTFTTNDIAPGVTNTLVHMERSSSNYGEGMTGQTYHVAVWTRALSLAEKQEFQENPYGLLMPRRNALYSFLAGADMPIPAERLVTGAANVPIQTTAGASTFPNLMPLPSAWTIVAGPGTVDKLDSPPTITIHSPGGGTTSIRTSVPTTIGSDYIVSFRISTNTAQVLLGTSNGGGQYKAALSSSPIGQFSFELRATATALWVQLQRAAVGDTVMTEFLVQELVDAPQTRVAGNPAMPMQTVLGDAVTVGAFIADGVAATPMLTATGAVVQVSGEILLDGTAPIPMQGAAGAIAQVTGVSAAGVANIPMQGAAGTAETRYNSARRLNGTNQYFESAVNIASNRNLGFYGLFRMELAPAPSGAYYIADYGNLSPGVGGGAGRIRLVYDAAAKTFLASTSSLDGTFYREARSAVITIDTNVHYFVGVSVTATGDVVLIVNKTKTPGAGGTGIPPLNNNTLNVFRIGSTARTTTAGFWTGTAGTWSLWVGGVPTNAELDMMADGWYPLNIPNLSMQPTSVWAMLGTGTTEADRIGSRPLTAVNSPTLVSIPDTPDFHFGAGTATTPKVGASGTAVVISLEAFLLDGAIAVPMIQAVGDGLAEQEGVRGHISIPMQLPTGQATLSVPNRVLSGAATTPMIQSFGTATVPTQQSGTFYTSTLTNTAAISSLVDQEVRVGLGCKRGDVPAGYIVKAAINGAAVKTQISRRRFWDDGSLKYGEASFLAPQMTAGQTVDVNWQKSTGTWNAQDTGLHSGPSAVISAMTAEYKAVAWTNKPTPTTLGTNIGPLTFKLSDMLSGTNAAWIRTVYTGHLTTEWEASIFAKRTDGTFHPDFACKVYVRAWGGTAATPKRIQIFFKSMYGWSDDSVPTTAYGYQVSWDFLIGGTVVRGTSLATPGWTDVGGFKGGAHFSVGTNGLMDWFDVSSQQVLVPPLLVHKHEIPYLIDARLLPNIDLNNTFDNSAAKKNVPYVPNTKGLCMAEMSDVGERDDITWGLTGWTARTMIAHNATVSIADTAAHQQTSRTQALAVGSLPIQGYRRDTRGMVSHMPDSRIPDPRLRPTYVGLFPEVTNSTWTGWTDLDAAHYPSLSYFNYLTEGAHHVLQLLYSEGGAPGNFTSPDYGKDTSVKLYDQPGEPTFPVAHQVIRGQIRGIARHVLQIGLVSGIGYPDDLETIYYTRILEDWCISSAQIPMEEDRWRTGTGHVDNSIYRSANDPIYKFWMHSLVLHGTCAAYGITRRADMLGRAKWWVELIKTGMGGYNDGPDIDKHIQATSFTSDEIYYTINPDGSRRIFSITRQWGVPINVTYNVNNTITVPSTAANHNDAVYTPFSATSPAALTRGGKYYAVQVAGTSGNRGGTLKLSATVGGAPINFGIASPVAAQAIYRSDPNVIAAPYTDGLNSGQNNGFGLQIMGALKHFYHNCEQDPVVEKAIKTIEPYKLTGGGGYVEKAKWLVSYAAQPSSTYQVFNGPDPVYFGADEVWSAIPPGTWNGQALIPMIQAVGDASFVPGLAGDTKGAFTIPMQQAVGQVEAPEVVFEFYGDIAIPMQVIVVTGTVEAPASDFIGEALIPMIQAVGSAEFAPAITSGNAIIPMQRTAGTAVTTIPVFSLGGNANIPLAALDGHIFISGVPIQGGIGIPMIQAFGAATSEQFFYEAAGDILIPMMEAIGEALWNAIVLDGGVEIPMQEINGIIEQEVPVGDASGEALIPMQLAAGTLDLIVPDLPLSGEALIPMQQAQGSGTAVEYIAVSGNFTIPMMESVPTLPPVWIDVPRSRKELWTVITTN